MHPAYPLTMRKVRTLLAFGALFIVDALALENRQDGAPAGT